MSGQRRGFQHEEGAPGAPRDEGSVSSPHSGGDNLTGDLVAGALWLPVGSIPRIHLEGPERKMAIREE